MKYDILESIRAELDKCTKCGKTHLLFHSCRNRHCPTCQGHKVSEWIQKRERELLPVSYFHVVFTLPDHLNTVALYAPDKLYAILFKTAWQTLSQFAENPKHLGAKMGMIGVLHTWGQNLSLHPHLHCIVPSGGVTKSGDWMRSQSKGKFLFDVKAMSKVFRTPVKKQDSKKAFITQTNAKHKIKTSKKQTREELVEQIVKPRQQNERAARLAEELSLTLQEFSQKPKEKFLTSRTKEYVAATYMRGWIDKVERLGNADYPDAAIRAKLSGTLILDVVINADGSLKEINLRRSSGHQILDDAAKRIVRMSSPFAPFPAKLLKQAEIIHITRSWEFRSNQLKSY